MDELLTKYFTESNWRGALQEDHSVRATDSAFPVLLYRCTQCAALTDEPRTHAEWHEGLNEFVLGVGRIASQCFCPDVRQA